MSSVKKRKRSNQRGSAAVTRAEREHQVDAIVERGTRLKRRAEELNPPATAPRKKRTSRKKTSSRPRSSS